MTAFPIAYISFEFLYVNQISGFHVVLNLLSFSNHLNEFFYDKCLKLKTAILVSKLLNFAIVLNIYFLAALNDGDRVLQINH